MIIVKGDLSFFTRTMYYNLSASLLLFTVIFMIGGCRLYKSRHVLKVAAKGATASARFVMKALWVRKRWVWKRLVMIMWNDKQDVKCKYKTLTARCTCNRNFCTTLKNRLFRSDEMLPFILFFTLRHGHVRYMQVVYTKLSFQTWWCHSC